MDKDERELFKAERQRLGLNQKDIEDKTGVGQGLISRIEIDPSYQPSLEIFKKAVTGIDLTLSSFYRRIEGLPETAPVEENSPPPSKRRAVRNETKTLVPSARDADEAIATLSELLALAREGRSALDRRQAPSADPTQAKRARHRQKRGKGAAQRPKTRRPHKDR